MGEDTLSTPCINYLPCNLNNVSSKFSIFADVIRCSVQGSSPEVVLETVSVKTHDISDRCNAYNLKLNAEEMQDL